MSFQVGIDSLGGDYVFSGGTLYPSANYEFIWGMQSHVHTLVHA